MSGKRDKSQRDVNPPSEKGGKQRSKGENVAKGDGRPVGGGNVSQKGKQGKQQQGQGGKKSGSSSKAVDEDVKTEQKLQAILLADSFNQTFRPVSLETPKVLLPLVNIPMINYTIEFLASNGVEEIIIFSVWLGNVIEEYISSSKWISSLSSSLSIRCITSSNCQSAGDALRELDSLGIVRSDPFILISGDVISNMNLKKAIDFHKMKRKQDANNIMTCTFKRISSSTSPSPSPSSSKSLFDDLILGLHPTSNQILFYEDLLTKNDISFSFELLSSNNCNEITFSTNNLVDCNIDICSQELLLQFSDNFDYQDIRSDFIRNEVTNFALGKHLYSYFLSSSEYAARIKDPYSYHNISRDIVTRWVYPFVPDSSLFSSFDEYSSGSGGGGGMMMSLSQHHHHSSKIKQQFVYKSNENVKISRTANIKEEVVIGKGTSVGNNSTISHTILGKDNKIGNSVNIVNSHIWNNVIIEDNVSIDSAIICDGAVIRQGAVIPKGCVISYHVKIGSDVKLKPFSRFTTVSTLS
jgi:translation initiation factor eIF-2B subunit epsilon